MDQMRKLLMLTWIAATGCGAGPTDSVLNILTITGTSPAAGTTVTLPQSYPFEIRGGLVIPPGSGHVSARINISVDESIPWAQLIVYLLTDGTNDQYCGQNSPDAPTWRSLERGWTSSVDITGFRVYRLPCDVTGFRAILHTRNSQDLNPPSAEQTIAEATVSTPIQLRR